LYLFSFSTRFFRSISQFLLPLNDNVVRPAEGEKGRMRGSMALVVRGIVLECFENHLRHAVGFLQHIVIP